MIAESAKPTRWSDCSTIIMQNSSRMILLRNDKNLIQARTYQTNRLVFRQKKNLYIQLS